jgi:hypothetical protein
VFNDAQRLDAGDGALVRPAAMQAVQGGAFDVLDVRVRPGVPLATALRPFEQSGGRWDRPTPPTSVRNLQRIAWLPWALAVAIAVLASAALGHALVMSVRSNRRELAVLRSLGFTRSTQEFFPGGPDLAVEILAPSNTRTEMDARLRDYFTSGTQRGAPIDRWCRGDIGVPQGTPLVGLIGH